MQMLAATVSAGIGHYLLYGGIAVLCGLLILLLRNPRALGKWALGGVGGCVALWAVNAAGAFTGVSVACNLWTVGAAIVLGLPGVVSLFFLKLLLRM
ncbi:pro-sigmaK processing inhibitor BofA family protein [Ethanoligenens harbinense]|uniref:SigmaK-factor processing regulatory BofA n=1 Tax=Ethanoligenens harbinense (strain DSM 18485 / JCM 12961 / CGMCC 1.5033 / YUAN-3) TaxID=663278 RepID=E6U9W8_ETHHY|nr:pro-sigmaK processing inhibitor BofA family protein [Ethanoligenens harbinense]ADU26234.1 sigmaK-factor processing regulatory BofA [Ethanoligenens harbinense YUAN-3]AVQ95369.1 transcriptional regulator [Ethanoligenens harbinense YUAN-3]AYF38035.1 transcriptional regulator [Ethanoligenens harbinense]AYF40780.1 transcriptional regulator [Ethanoligenens harbinense]QCN91611.1 transcriptional regulator [Ethanoligenens harbinense]